MPAPEILSPAAIETALEELPGWSLDGGALVREFVFRDFVQAFAFMTRVALVAEKRNHHPDWSNVYQRVRIRLSTHESGGITERDLDLARRIQTLEG